jgi:adenosine kinase
MISPNDPGAMIQYAEECRTLGIPYIWDPGQQCARMEGDELRQGVVGAALVMCNDYELELLRQKTGLGEAEILAHAGGLVVTKGELGCTVFSDGAEVDVPAVAPTRIVDPTGVGDAFRGGFLKGIARGADAVTSAKLGAVAAAYALEHLGGQSHAYTWAEFQDRYAGTFGTHPPLE